MAYSIAQVARMSGITSRTLRHYDDVGLLSPAFTGAGGYRFYEDEQLLRLQEILVLRELDLGLGEIREVLDRDTDRLDALRKHHERLLAERERYDRLARSVQHTIDTLEGGRAVNAQELFTGLARDSEQARELADEAEQRWPGARETHAKVTGWSDEKWQAVQAEGAEASERIAGLLREGVAADDPRTVETVDAHYRWILHFWTPNRESYTGLGRLYADDERFASGFEQVEPGLAAYLADAMAAYARHRLT
ncbi:hypothetical protein BJF85_12815 [Saccharomonospora sp. CUA-673]|uniref:MerR family transcriptional regulator n=1 Tax=Saccharomonospora sp. CUA-673 TaxID=1904969 RepID=UPI0009688119|nr:MerR family transcriptional regulator [Saccharomonospora sp. CUA-673]OLT48394.1 hypothetical protein BJF85_12815 [Saccharomonospora sp. CUA-673]